MHSAYDHARLIVGSRSCSRGCIFSYESLFLGVRCWSQYFAFQVDN